MDDLVEKIFNLETPVVPPVVQDPTVTQLSDKVDKLTQVLASVLQSPIVLLHPKMIEEGNLQARQRVHRLHRRRLGTVVVGEKVSVS